MSQEKEKYIEGYQEDANLQDNTETIHNSNDYGYETGSIQNSNSEEDYYEDETQNNFQNQYQENDDYQYTDNGYEGSNNDDKGEGNSLYDENYEQADFEYQGDIQQEDSYDEEYSENTDEIYESETPYGNAYGNGYGANKNQQLLYGGLRPKKRLIGEEEDIQPKKKSKGKRRGMLAFDISAFFSKNKKKKNPVIEDNVEEEQLEESTKSIDWRNPINIAGAVAVGLVFCGFVMFGATEYIRYSDAQALENAVPSANVQLPALHEMKTFDKENATQVLNSAKDVASQGLDSIQGAVNGQSAGEVGGFVNSAINSAKETVGNVSNAIDEEKRKMDFSEDNAPSLTEIQANTPPPQ